MVHRPDTRDYRSLLLGDVPMMDMRAPAEFSQGAFPCAHSLPLMSDEERVEVGICYKKHGQKTAIELGHKLVCGSVRDQRMAQWAEFTRTYPQGYLYCFRGGLRSQTVQQWLLDAGIDYPLIEGGYKAMRQFLLAELARSVEQADFVLIAGKTGTGKTKVIEQLVRSVDLEGLAVHRGSSFGQLLEPQPRQIDFENSLSIALMKLLTGGKQRIYLEDEGRLIGRLYLPDVLQEKMKEAPMAVVEQSMVQRIDVVVDDYVLDLGRRYTTAHGERGAALHSEKMQADLLRIRKRLGGERYEVVSALMTAAFEQQWRDGDLSLHREWVAALLDQYYDAMYDYQLSKRSGRELFRGSREDVIEWAASHR
ncbi:MAG: tRNA 2-selenouridine(34) synthase MnmH [Proteobacteria bacterium]|nr:tRNA 2-selenouridine(34) synthase MnmH [Pseudomonadota bacterium]